MLKLNTFSITARCARTGEVGIAVSTAVPAVGMLAPFVRGGAGAVSTQSFVNPYLGLWGLDHLADGLSAEETLDRLRTSDAGIEYRQLAVVDREGGSAAFTGNRCDTWHGHLTGPNYAIAGNMLVGAATLDAMEASFAQTGEEPLSQRLLLALAAGQEAGGDKRGRQSAALKVYGAEAYPALDLRVDEHSDPVAELRRIYAVAQADLVPLLEMLPTRTFPEGTFDLARLSATGLLQD